MRRTLRAFERFGIRDSELRASASGPLGPSWTVGAEASASPELRQGDLYTRTGARLGLRRHF